MNRRLVVASLFAVIGSVFVSAGAFPPPQTPDGDAPPASRPATPPARPRRPNADPAQSRPAEGNPRRERARAALESRVPESIQLVRDVIYAQASGDDGAMIDLKMDTAFLKESDGKPMPAVIYIHGGAWEGGSKEFGLRQTVGLALGGYFSVTIDYRLSGQAKYPAAVHDCKAAIRFLRANAEKLGIDPDRIGVWGHSAGGHLAALMGTSGDSPEIEGKVGSTGVSAKVQCVIDMSGPVDLHIDAADGVISRWLGGSVREHEDLAKQASPLTYIDAKDPPVLIVQGMDDPLVNLRQAKLFEEALKAAGVPVETMYLEGVGHLVESPAVMFRAADFFDAHLRGHAGTAVRDFAARMGVPTSAPTTQPEGGRPSR